MAMLSTTLEQFLQHCQQTAWRGLLHIAGEQPWVTHCLDNILQTHTELQAVTVSNNVQRLQSQLGSESNCLVIDAFQGFNPNRLGMASATLKAGGLLIVLSPEFGQWQYFDDPDYAKMLGAIDANSSYQRRFLQRSQQFLAQCKQSMRLRQADNSKAEQGLWQVAACQLHAAEQHWQPQAGDEQQQAIASIKSCALGRANRPLVLTADRGRGKSAALGIASAELLQQHTMDIAITSVSPRSVERLFFHLAEGLQQEAGKKSYCHQAGSARFYAIDELLQQLPDCQLLIIDEAAAVPHHLLQQCVKHYKRIVFSSTIKGYEGSGRGFELRFLPFLQQHSQQVRYQRLYHAMRWPNNDPLEQSINRLLLLDIEQTSDQQTLAVKPLAEHGELREIAQHELLADEALLRQFFALMVNAHYQTSPDDLRMMLDHPKMKLFALQYQDQLLAAALILQEGQLSAAWQQKLQQGRRPSGHLLPQILLNEGFSDAPEHSFWRVMRIAVQPELQRQGLGQVLLQAIERRCNADMLAASFSLSSDVLPFWQSQAYAVCRLGSHKSSATGQFSVVVCKALSLKAIRLQERMTAQYQQNLPLLFLSLNQNLEAKTALLLLRNLVFALAEQDRQQVRRFAAAKASLEQVFPYLFRWILYKAGRNELQTEDLLLLDKVLLNKNWQQLSSLYNLSGRKMVESQMRARCYQQL